jgi:ComF family protein
MGRYESVLLEAIHDLKYRGRIATGVALGNLLASYIGQYLPVQDYDLVIPVPLHKKRLRERGFNQSLIIAKSIARNFSLTIDFQSLRRLTYTEPQINLGRKERESNVRNAFAVVREKAVADSRILLVDDVYTTGSTVKECARTLLKSGAKSVAVATLARA